MLCAAVKPGCLTASLSSRCQHLSPPPAPELVTAVQANFTDDAHGATTGWLGIHQASLFGTVDGSAEAVALTLSSAQALLRLFWSASCQPLAAADAELRTRRLLLCRTIMFFRYHLSCPVKVKCEALVCILFVMCFGLQHLVSMGWHVGCGQAHDLSGSVPASIAFLSRS